MVYHITLINLLAKIAGEFVQQCIEGKPITRKEENNKNALAYGRFFLYLFVIFWQSNA